MHLEQPLAGVGLEELVDVLLTGGDVVGELGGAAVEVDPLAGGDLADRVGLGIDPDLVEDAGGEALADGPGDDRRAVDLAEVLLLEALAAEPGGDHGEGLHRVAFQGVTVQSEARPAARTRRPQRSRGEGCMSTQPPAPRTMAIPAATSQRRISSSA